ncbi:MAG: formylglycine-generating enzyme family protein, partial [Treponema sp.]|nr:formylglycine-generating enzyme family protein [Treponema sp.]
MKKFLQAAATLLFCQLICAPIFCRPIKKQSNDQTAFNDINMVQFKASQPEAEYDIFTIGETTQSYTAERFVQPFSMNAYETTYNLWYIGRIYAEQNGYTFANPGQEGSGGKRGAAPTALGNYQPVTMISWYDAVVWCNA